MEAAAAGRVHVHRRGMKAAMHAGRGRPGRRDGAQDQGRDAKAANQAASAVRDAHGSTLAMAMGLASVAGLNVKVSGAKVTPVFQVRSAV